MSDARTAFGLSLPRHWRTSRLGAVVSVIGGATPSKDEPAYWDGGIPWVSPKDMKVDVLADAEDHVSSLGVERSALRFIQPPAVLIVIRGMILAHTVPVALTAARLTVNQDMKALLPRPCLDARFLAYQMRARSSALLAMVEEAGHGTRCLRTDLWRKLPVGVPPLDEQRAIADFLDRKTVAIDALIERKEGLARSLEEKRQAILAHTVTRGLHPSVELRSSGLEWLGRIPKHWDVAELKRLIRSGTSITYGIVQAGPHIEDGIPYIKTSDMAGEELPLSGYAKTSPEIDFAYRRSKVAAGDVVVAIRATVGKALVVPPKLDGANLTQGTAKISPGPRLVTKYLWYLLRSATCQQRFEALAKGVTFREITLDMLRRFQIPLPPVQEQEEICRYLSHQDDSLRACHRQVEASGSPLLEYRQALITAAVTGQLNLNKDAA